MEKNRNWKFFLLLLFLLLCLRKLVQVFMFRDILTRHVMEGLLHSAVNGKEQQLARNGQARQREVGAAARHLELNAIGESGHL